MEERKIHWTELFGNKFRFALHPLMLCPGGYQTRLVTQIKGESRGQLFAVVIVTFDEGYVVEYLAKNAEALKPPRHIDWMKIVNKAYDCWNQKKQVQ